jgi:hypothetical protein
METHSFISGMLKKFMRFALSSAKGLPRIGLVDLPSTSSTLIIFEFRMLFLVKKAASFSSLLISDSRYQLFGGSAGA